ncbi:MAG: hypothetical protein WBD37_09505 [Anderseniella sp.]
MNHRAIRIFSTLVFLLVNAGITTAQKPPAWELALRAQLLAEQQCNLNYLTNVKVQDLGVVKSIEARAHCANGQAYDVKSLKGTNQFDIRACGISIC